MQKYNNTAGRLLNVFQIAREATGSSGGENTEKVWGSVLAAAGATHDQNSGARRKRTVLYTQLAELSNALCEVESDISELKSDQAELYTRDFRRLFTVLSPTNLAAAWSSQSQDITDTALTALEFTASALPKDDEISQDELQEIKTLVEELFEQVRVSQISTPLKKWMLQMLSAMKKAIDNFYIYGARAFRDSLVQIVGELAVNSPGSKDVSDQDRALWDKFGVAFAKMNDLASKMRNSEYLLIKGGELVAITSAYLLS